MAMTIYPEWMDKVFFENVIKYYKNDDKAVVKDFTIKSGSNCGENFASEMFRAIINFSTMKCGDDSISVIIKVKPNESGDIDAERMFITEMKMYSETLIDINRLLLRANEGDNDDVKLRLFPSLIYHSTEHAAIVLEDLSKNGFKTLHAPKDYETSEMIFHRLAMYHAASFYLTRKENFDFSCYNYSVYHMPDSIQESFFRHNLRIFKNLVLNNQWPEINKPENIKRIDEVIQKCTERGQKVFTKSPGGFNVLNHGDFFMRNMLFHEIDGKVSDVRFLDFQLPCFSSPAVDIFQALYGSMTTENRKKYRNKIILFYYETFVSTLKKLGYDDDLPTLNDLNVELIKNGALGAQICICYLPYLLCEWNKVDTDVMYVVNKDTESSKRELYQTEAFAEILGNEFEDFFYKGFI